MRNYIKILFSAYVLYICTASTSLCLTCSTVISLFKWLFNEVLIPYLWTGFQGPFGLRFVEFAYLRGKISSAWEFWSGGHGILILLLKMRLPYLFAIELIETIRVNLPSCRCYFPMPTLIKPMLKMMLRIYIKMLLFTDVKANKTILNMMLFKLRCYYFPML